MKNWALALAAVFLALTTAGSALAAQSTAAITLNLTKFSAVQHAAAGDYAGVSPGVTTVHVGDRIVFVNTDSAHHTATAIAGAASFPTEPRWSATELKASGEIGGPSWSTGDIAPGARSAALIATKPGTYLFGCFFDYSAGMRGVII